MSEDQRVRISSALMVSFATVASVSSALILIRLWRIPQWHTFHRLMLGMSGLDLLQWSAIALGPLLVPRQALEGILPTFGNTATCRFQGFAFTLGSGGSYLYNALIMLYFLLVIGYGLTERFLTQKVEVWLHLLGSGVYLGLAVLGLAKGWIHSYPLGAFCDIDHYRSISSAFLLLQCTWTIFAMVFLAMTIQKVVKKFAQSRRFVFADSSARTFRSAAFDATNNSSRSPSGGDLRTEWNQNTTTRLPQGNSSAMERRQALVISQALLYGIVFVITGLTNAFFYVTQVLLKDQLFVKYFWLDVAIRNFYVLLSVVNLIIFIRPQYQKLRRPRQGGGDPPMTRWQAFRCTIWHPMSNNHSSAAQRSKQRCKNPRATTRRPIHNPIPAAGQEQHTHAASDTTGQGALSGPRYDSLRPPQNPILEEPVQTISNTTNPRASGLGVFDFWKGRRYDSMEYIVSHEDSDEEEDNPSVELPAMELRRTTTNHDNQLR